jgi:hypothetical protein
MDRFKALEIVLECFTIREEERQQFLFEKEIESDYSAPIFKKDILEAYLHYLGRLQRNLSRLKSIGVDASDCSLPFAILSKGRFLGELRLSDMPNYFEAIENYIKSEKNPVIVDIFYQIDQAAIKAERKRNIQISYSASKAGGDIESEITIIAKSPLDALDIFKALS